MPDSNEIKKPTTDAHPRLRLPQSGITAQRLQDEGEPLTTESYKGFMFDLMLDVANGRIDRNTALTVIAAGNQIVQAAKLDLQSREMAYRYDYKHEQSLEVSERLELAPRQKKPTLKKKAS